MLRCCCEAVLHRRRLDRHARQSRDQPGQRGRACEGAENEHSGSNAAVEAAERAFPAWAKLTAKQRSNILRKWFDLIIANREDLALILTSEQGKPLAEALGEVDIGGAYVEFFAEEARRSTAKPFRRSGRTRGSWRSASRSASAARSRRGIFRVR